MRRLGPPGLVVPLLVGLFVLSLYLFTGSSDLKQNGDTYLRYQTTQAIVDHHRIWVSHPEWLDTRMALGLGHHLYAYYAPGQTLLMVPLYVAGKVLAHHLSLPYDITTLYTSRSLDLFLGAILVVLFFLMARSVGYSVRVASCLALIFGLATPAWPDAQSALDQTQVDLFILLSVYSVWRFTAHGFRNRRWLLLAGLGAGLAVFTRYDAILFAPVIALYPAVLRFQRAQRRSLAADWLAFGSGIVPWLLLVGVWNTLRFGSPFLTGLHEKTFGEPIWSGLLGLTISPGKGILWYLPVVWLLPWAVPGFYRRHDSFAVFLGAMVLVPLLFYSTVLYWHGDPAWGPRYLYTALPYLILPLGEIFRQWRKLPSYGRGITAALILISLAIQMEAVSVTQWRFWYRLEVMEASTSQPFRWGAQYYHYYWNIRQSPIVMQLDDVYQVLRLDVLGDRRYRLTNRPTPCLAVPGQCPSNPADNYPVNTLLFWWADVRHPILGAHTRLALALLLALTAASSFGALTLRLRGMSSPAIQRRRIGAPEPETAA